jgi:hypothetical protein
LLYGVGKVSRRRHERKLEKTRRHASDSAGIRPAESVARLAYSIVQAAEVLGVSASTVRRSVVPFVETVELEGGRVLIPVDELERYVAERRRPVPPRPTRAPVGRPAAVPREVVGRIRAERAAGRTLGQIASGLDADQIPTAQGGRRWWPSSVRAVLLRSDPPSHRVSLPDR